MEALSYVILVCSGPSAPDADLKPMSSLKSLSYVNFLIWKLVWDQCLRTISYLERLLPFLFFGGSWLCRGLQLFRRFCSPGARGARCGNLGAQISAPLSAQSFGNCTGCYLKIGAALQKYSQQHSNKVLQTKVLKKTNPCKQIRRHACVYNIYLYIYIMAVELLSGPSLAFFKGYLLVQVSFFAKPCLSKHYKIGASELLGGKKFARNKVRVIIWSKLALFFKGPTWIR